MKLGERGVGKRVGICNRHTHACAHSAARSVASTIKRESQRLSGPFMGQNEANERGDSPVHDGVDRAVL